MILLLPDQINSDTNWTHIPGFYTCWWSTMYEMQWKKYLIQYNTIGSSHYLLVYFLYKIYNRLASWIAFFYPRYTTCRRITLGLLLRILGSFGCQKYVFSEIAGGRTTHVEGATVMWDWISFPFQFCVSVGKSFFMDKWKGEGGLIVLSQMPVPSWT